MFTDKFSASVYSYICVYSVREIIVRYYFYANDGISLVRKITINFILQNKLCTKYEHLRTEQEALYEIPI